MTLHDREVINVKVEKVNLKQYPIFAEASILYAEYMDNGKALTDKELIELKTKCPHNFKELCIKKMLLNMRDAIYK